MTNKKNIIKYALCGIAGLLLGVYLFLPWDGICGYFLALGQERLSGDGIYVTAREWRSEGIFNKVFVYDGVTADLPVVRFESREISVDPAMISTLFLRAPSCRLKFGRGSVTPMTRQKMEWTAGEASVRAEGGNLVIDDIYFAGKFSARGSLSVSASTGKLSGADLRLKLPADMDRAMQLLSKSGLLPLTNSGPGQWTVKK